MPLDAKTAVITGGGTGIGRALAIEASRRRIAVALVGRREDKLRETRARLHSLADCLIVPADVTSVEGRRSIRDAVANKWGRLDVLVNNAGVVAAGPLAEARDADLARLMATNVVAPLALTREMVPLLRAAAPSRVVNVGSMLGDIGFPLFAGYSASKFALRGLSDALRRELRSFGIGVSYIAPRGARTDAMRAVARFVEPFGMPADSTDTIARQLWDAVAKGRNSAYPGGRERLFVLVARLFPAIVDRAIATQLESSGMRRLIEDDSPLPTTGETPCLQD